MSVDKHVYICACTVHMYTCAKEDYVLNRIGLTSKCVQAPSGH